MTDIGGSSYILPYCYFIFNLFYDNTRVQSNMCKHKFIAFIYGWKTVHNSHFCYLKITLKISFHFLMKILSKACYIIFFGNNLCESISPNFLLFVSNIYFFSLYNSNEYNNQWIPTTVSHYIRYVFIIIIYFYKAKQIPMKSQLAIEIIFSCRSSISKTIKQKTQVFLSTTDRWKFENLWTSGNFINCHQNLKIGFKSCYIYN